MAAQTVLPFKLGITNDKITPHGGLAFFGEFVHALGVEGILSQALPAPGSGAGHQPEENVIPLLLMLHGRPHAVPSPRQVVHRPGWRRGPAPESCRAGEAFHGLRFQ